MQEAAQSEPKNTKLNGFEQGLSRKQVEAIPYLVGARSLEEGCRKARVAKSTLYQWLKDEPFRKELARHREQITSEALERLKASITRAVDGLIELVGDKDKGIRFRAIEKVLDFFMKVKEADELEARLEKVERVMLERRTYR